MLGRTNLLYVPENESMDLHFNQEYILTSTSHDIVKIENINNVFFAFSADESVLYGSDIEKLKYLKNGLELLKAKHIIFADDVYYLTTIENTQGKAVIYKTQDFVTFEEVVLKTGDSSYYYPVHGLFLNSTGEIVAFIEQTKGGGDSTTTKYLLVTDSLLMYDEHNANFIEVGGQVIKYKSATSTKLKKDRIFTYNGSSSWLLTFDGTFSPVDRYSFFAAGYFLKIQNTNNKFYLYYSINGVNYSLVDFQNVVDYSILYTFEYDGYIAHIYSCTEDGKTVKKLVVADTPKGLADAVSDAITVDIEFSLLEDSHVYKDDYVYLGSTGGIITKAKIESSGAIRPDISLLKTLSAKQALKEANEYTERLFAELEERVAALEEAAN